MKIVRFENHLGFKTKTSFFERFKLNFRLMLDPQTIFNEMRMGFDQLWFQSERREGSKMLSLTMMSLKHRSAWIYQGKTHLSWSWNFWLLDLLILKFGKDERLKVLRITPKDQNSNQYISRCFIQMFSWLEIHLCTMD